VPQVTPTPELAPALEPLPAFPDPLALPEVGLPDAGAPDELPAPDDPEDPLATPLEPLPASLEPLPTVEPLPPPEDPTPLEPPLPPSPSRRSTALPPQDAAAPVTRVKVKSATTRKVLMQG
jgi:hypothetical protein